MRVLMFLTAQRAEFGQELAVAGFFDAVYCRPGGGTVEPFWVVMRLAFLAEHAGTHTFDLRAEFAGGAVVRQANWAGTFTTDKPKPGARWFIQNGGITCIELAPRIGEDVRLVLNVDGVDVAAHELEVLPFPDQVV